MSAKFLLFVALLALQLVDYATTVYVLRNGGREMNPFAARVFAVVGVERGLLALKAALVVLFAWQYPALPWWVFAGLSVFYTYFMYGNIRAAWRTYQRKHS